MIEFKFKFLEWIISLAKQILLEVIYVVPSTFGIGIYSVG